MEDAEAPDVLNWELEAEASDVISWVFEAEAPEDALSWVLEAEAPDTLSWVSKAEAPDALSCVLEAEAPNALSWVLEAEAPNALGVAVAPVGLSRLEKLSSKSMNGKTSPVGQGGTKLWLGLLGGPPLGFIAATLVIISRQLGHLLSLIAFTHFQRHGQQKQWPHEVLTGSTKLTKLRLRHTVQWSS